MKKTFYKRIFCFLMFTALVPVQEAISSFPGILFLSPHSTLFLNIFLCVSKFQQLCAELG